MKDAAAAHRLLRGLVGKVREEHKAEPPAELAVTISRDCACGGEEIARQIAAELHMQCYDRELLEAIAEQAHIDQGLMERLDEHIAPMMDEWIFGLISGRGVGNEDYRRHLARVVLSIWSRGGVIVGRGAHLLLASRRVWRVRITGSPEICAQRLMRQKQVSHSEAQYTVRRINTERAEFLRKQFGAEISDLTAYDLALNTDRIALTDAAGIVLDGMKRAGHTLAPVG